MTFSQLLLRNLAHHRLANLAVFLGVVVGTAVLTGALLIGDSLRGSLRGLTRNRLGRINHALTGGRFFQADLAERLGEDAAAVILLRGTALHRNGDKIIARVGRVQIVGVDTSFWSYFDQEHSDLENGLIINQALADELQTRAGDLVELRVEKPQVVPTDSLLGRPVRENSVAVEASRITEVIPNFGPGRFTLNAQQVQPLIAYVQLRRLQTRLARENVQPSGSANTLLVHAGDYPLEHILDRSLGEAMTLEDLGLSLKPDQTGQRYLSLESRRMILEPVIADAALKIASREHVRPTLTYLANVMINPRQVAISAAAGIADFLCQPTPMELAGLARATVAYTPYSAITGLDPSEPVPWGPLTFVDGKAKPIEDDEIVLNEWAAKDLWPLGNWRQDIGQPVVTIRYFVESDGWLLKEESKTLKLAGVVQLKGAAADRALTPEFPGLRGTSVADWEPPFPKEQWHPEWVRPRDEQYWRRYRATPKAFVSPATAQKLWKSRYGQWTSIRFAPIGAGRSLAEIERNFRRDIREFLTPEAVGMQFQPVKAQGLEAAKGSTAESFGWLFLGFSFFLIASAAMLVGLLFRLGIERRMKEIGLLYAAGFRRRFVRRLLLSEGAIIAAAGGLIGLAAAVGYTWLLLNGLRDWWGEKLQTSFLNLHVSVPSLAIGFALSFGVAMIAIIWGLRGLRHMSPSGLLAGQVADSEEMTSGIRTPWISGVCLLGAGALAVGSTFVPNNVAAPLFFGSGQLLLIGVLGLTRRWLRGHISHVIEGQGISALIRLGGRNIARQPGRSLLTMALLASAVFLVVAVESFRKNVDNAGTGGFSLIAESDVPLYRPPNTAEMRRALLPEMTNEEAGRLNQELADVELYGFRLRPGDDVSCLNLYQPQKPRILGVPDEFIKRGGFSFTSVSESNEQNPWQLLHQELDGDRVPVFADEHTATWVLHLSLGQEWTITDERGQQVHLQLAGLLKGSIFQSELLMSEGNFRRLFPNQAGYRFFMIDAPAALAQDVKQTLEQAFGETFGFNVSRSSDRLAAFLAVENTYLSTFQILGGFGLLLGTLGLAVVLLRNVWERRGELALLRALGYRHSALSCLVLAENAFLLLLGLAIGVISALLAVAPHLWERAAQIPWLGLLGLLISAVVLGLVAATLALASTLRTPLLPALRKE